jgi:Mg/Co/Ni transporter MgtE
MDAVVITDHAPDPVILRRRRIARWVGLAKRVGYFLLLLAIATFAAAAISSFDGVLVAVTVVALIAACVILPVPIVMGYGLRAAEREDRQPT